MPAKPKTFDDCLAGLRPDQRAALEKLRKTIHAAAPGAEEYVGYGLAAFRLDGKPLVALGAAANHCAFYLMSGSMVDTHAAALKNYDTSKGTIRFPADKPLPAALVKKLVKARIAENASHRWESQKDQCREHKAIRSGSRRVPSQAGSPAEEGDRDRPADHPRCQSRSPRGDQVEFAELPHHRLLRNPQPPRRPRLAHPPHRREGEGQRHKRPPHRRPHQPPEMARQGPRAGDVREREGCSGEEERAEGAGAGVDWVDVIRHRVAWPSFTSASVARR